MLNMLTKKSKMKKSKKFLSSHRLITLVLAIVLTGGFLAAPFAMADEFDRKINQLRSQNAKKEKKQELLENKATTFQDKVNGLQTQINLLEGQITKDQARSEELRQRIADAEAKLEEQKDLLGQNIKQMYLEGQITTLEMLASSRDLSEFVDKEQYRNSVKDKIKTTLDEINALRLELKSSRDALEKTIAARQERQASLDKQRAEQAHLLSLNAAQRSALEGEINENNEKIAGLRAEQAAENALLFGSGLRNIPDTSGYPWANYQPFPNEVSDPWGMYLRQCVSYTAWKVWRSGRHMPNWGGIGNANQWDDNARRAGIPVDGKPRVGDVAISNSGYYGHSMYVEHVYGDGRILISQYNAGWDGRYSEAIVHAGSLVFIHFP